MKTAITSFIETLKLSDHYKTADKFAKPQRGVFSILLNAEAAKKMGDEMNNRISEVTDTYFNAVVLCRKNKINEALTVLHHGDTAFENFEDEPKSLIRLFKLSAWANYHYKAGQFNQGIDLLVSGLSLSAKLEAEGYEVLQFRRIEQLQNVSRILFSSKKHLEGFTLIRSIFRFIIGGNTDGLYVKDWNHQKFTQIRQMMENTLDSVFLQLAILNSSNQEKSFDDLFYYDFFFKELLETMEADTYNRSILYNWMYVKASYFKEGPEAFLNNISIFLKDEEISPDYHKLKENLLLQSIQVLEKYECEDFKKMQESVYLYLNNLQLVAV
ncbi:hypothetical protein [Pedobacter terrae]|uniref:hypothetical protein n=1 Tax=Pedobacter terrae TaxID=405671 RepID=UPI002FF8840C